MPRTVIDVPDTMTEGTDMLASYNMRTIGTGRGFHPDLVAGIKDACTHHVGQVAGPLLIVRGVGARISSENVARLIYQKELGAEELSDIGGLSEYFAAIDLELLSGRSRGDVARRRARGLIDLTDGTLSSHAESPNDAIGFLAVVPDGDHLTDEDGTACSTASLIWLVANSARKADLVISPHSAVVVPWEELIRQTWAAIPSMKQLAVVRPDRLGRARSVFGNILEDIGKRRHSEVRIGNRVYDPRSQADSLLLALEAGNAATAVSEKAEAMLVGELRLLEAGRWHRGEENVPYGMRFTRTTDGGDVIADTVTKRLERDPEFLPAFRSMAILEAQLPRGADRRRELIAVAGALAGARDKRRGRRLWVTRLWPLLSEEQRGNVVERIEDALGNALPASEAEQLRELVSSPPSSKARKVAQSLAAARVAKVFETQVLHDLRRGKKHVRRVGFPGLTHYSGWSRPAKYVGPHDDCGYWDFDLPVGEHDDLGLSAEVWNLLSTNAKARGSSTAQQPAEAPPTGHRASPCDQLPLSGLVWTADGLHYKLEAVAKRSYKVLRATDEELGPRSGWSYATQIGLLAATPLHAAISNALVTGDDQDLVPDVDVAESLAPSPVADTVELETARAAHEAKQNKFNLTVAGLGALPPGSEEHERAQARVTELAAELRVTEEVVGRAQEANTLAAEGAATTKARKPVRPSTVRALALGLARARPLGPRDLAAAARLAFNDGGLVCTFADDPSRSRAVEIELRPRVLGASADTMLDCPAITVVNIFKPRGEAGRGVALDDVALMLRLDAGLRWDEIAAQRGVATPAAIRGAHAFLKAKGLHPGCADALVSMPPSIPGAAFLAAEVTDSEAPQLDDAYASVLRSAYLEDAEWTRQCGWLRVSVVTLQQVADLLVACGGYAPIGALIARVPGLTETSLRSYLRAPGNHLPGWVPPFRLENHGRLVRLVRCPHQGCGGWASVVCPVPEVLITGHAVICPRCYRVPDLKRDELRYSPVYVHPERTWSRSGTFAIGGTATHPVDVDRRKVAPDDADFIDGTVTRGELARLHGVPVSVVTQWCDENQLATVVVGGRPCVPVGEFDVAKKLSTKWRRAHGVQRGRRLPAPPKTANGATYLSTAEVARLLDVSEPTVHRLTETADLTAHPHGARSRWDPTEVDALIERIGLELGRSLEHLADLVATQQAADRLELSRWTFTKYLIGGGFLPTARLGHRWLVHPDDVDALDAHVVEALRDGWTIADAKNDTGRATHTIEAAILDGVLPAVHFGDKTYRILATDARSWHLSLMVCDVCYLPTHSARRRYCDAHLHRLSRAAWKREQERLSRRCEEVDCDEPPRGIIGRGRPPRYCARHARS